MRTRLTLITVLIAVATLLQAGLAQADPLERRSRIEMKAGLWMMGSRMTSEIGAGGVETTTENSGPVGIVAYSYWIQENLAFTSTFSILSVELKSKISALGVGTNTSGVYSVSVGVRYYVPKSTYKTSWRPYVAAAVGPYVGAETKSEVGMTVVTESHTETAIGGYLGGGLDIEVGHHFMLGISTGYHLITDFTESVGSRKNFSSPEFAFGISYLFGQGVRAR